MIDLKLDSDGDLELTSIGDIQSTDSIVQAVRIRLLWFFREWRLVPDFGFPYYEYLFVKNPNQTKLRHLIRETVLAVDGVRDVLEINFTVHERERTAEIGLTFTTDEDTFRTEVKIL